MRIPDTPGQSVHILIPAHDRRDVTLSCLQRLQAEGVFDWATVIVIDDGSIDDTSAAIRRKFPEVDLLTGDGHLFWTGAIQLGMRHAVARGAEHVFWLNDDCLPEPGALAELLSVSRQRNAITGGVCAMPQSRIPVYGGFKKGALDLEFVSASTNEPVACDALNGNLVCIPRTIISIIGYPDGRGLPHALGDTDYTLRARAAGCPVLLVGTARAQATPNNRRGYASWSLSGMGVREVWATLFDRRAYGYLPADLRYRWRHWGLLGIGRVFWQVAKRIPASAAILLLPLGLRRRWWGHRSASWQQEKLIRGEPGHE